MGHCGSYTVAKLFLPPGHITATHHWSKYWVNNLMPPIPELSNLSKLFSDALYPDRFLALNMGG